MNKLNTPIQKIRFAGLSGGRKYSRPEPSNAESVLGSCQERSEFYPLFKGTEYRDLLKWQPCSPFFEGKGKNLNLKV